MQNQWVKNDSMNMTNKQNEAEKTLLVVSRALIVIIILFIVVAGIFIGLLVDSGSDRLADRSGVTASPAVSSQTISSSMH